MAKTTTADKRENAQASVSSEELRQKAEEKLTEEGTIVESSEKEHDTLREKFADTFDYYPEVEFLWVVDEMPFLPKDLSLANNYATSVKRKITKVLR